MLIENNPIVEACVGKSPEALNMLRNIQISRYYTPNITWTNEGTLYYHIPTIRPQTHIALLDIDWTVSYAQKSLMNWDPTDIHIIPGRLETLTQLFKMGYTIVFVSNQYAVSTKIRLAKMERVGNFLRLLKIPCYALLAMGKDEYRKPELGMWRKLQILIPNIKYAFFVGDALGRPQDFSDSDKVFAQGARIPWYSPEDFFGISPRVDLPRGGKNMVILVGMPGSGKSSWASERSLFGYDHLQRDLLKTKFHLELKRSVKAGREGIIVDATNPSQKDREVYYNLAHQWGYDVTVVYFIRDGSGWNKIREADKKVPDIVYHIFFKKLDPPTQINTPGKLYLIY